jgi:hypothetical protein
MERVWWSSLGAARLPVMPIHSAMSSRFPLLESVPSIQALMEDPQYAQVRAEFESHPDYQAADVSVRPDTAPGPHGPVPVRVYNDGAGDGSRACLVWMHGGAFMMGNPDMPEADWASRQLAQRADAVVVSVDYRLCQGGVHLGEGEGADRQQGDDGVQPARDAERGVEDAGHDRDRQVAGVGDRRGRLGAAGDRAERHEGNSAIRSLPTQYSRRRRRDLVSAANPIDAWPRIVGRQVGLIRGCDDG